MKQTQAKQKARQSRSALARYAGGAAALAALALAGCQQQQAAAPPPPAPAPAPEVVEIPIEVPVAVPVAVPACNLPLRRDANAFVTEAWALPNETFDVGEPLALQMRVSAEAHVSVFHVSSSCHATRLLDNHPVQGGEIVDFPLRGSGISMTVKPPAGNEYFYFIATRDPITFLSAADVLNEMAGIASLDIDAGQLMGRIDDARGRVNPPDWSMTTLRTQVVAR